jgi:uncharacterized protein (TIGR00251 family)
MLLTVRVHPRASRPRTEWKEGVLEVWIIAPPAEGRANRAVLKVVARELGVPVSRLNVRSGARSRTKLIEVEGR